MAADLHLETIRGIMADFAAGTGLDPAGLQPQRYLWTDAFAVANFLELYRLTGAEVYLELARRLVDQVHQVLGRHRPDDSRLGWLSGLPEEEGKRHPTAGGLRIGKPLPERAPGDPPDPQLEWERDGQYYHYLVKWLLALLLIGRVTGEPRYLDWGRELARTMHARFLCTAYTGGPTIICWKMSIDLSRPQVNSMGQHDALDGLLTFLALQMEGTGMPDLSGEIKGLTALCRARQWSTDDPLGLGSLLHDALQAGQLIARGVAGLDDLLSALLAQARPGLAAYARRSDLHLPADYRLAFRELGLSLGLRAATRLQDLIVREKEHFQAGARLRELLELILEYLPLGEAVEHFWLDPAHRVTPGWQEHLRINQVMLATSLSPDTFLGG